MRSLRQRRRRKKCDASFTVCVRPSTSLTHPALESPQHHVSLPCGQSSVHPPHISQLVPISFRRHLHPIRSLLFACSVAYDMGDSPRATKRAQRDRVAAACDLCRARKVKCDGTLPCAYCVSRKRAEACVFSRSTPQHVVSHAAGTSAPTPLRVHSSQTRESTPSHDDVQAEESTEVPLEARLLRDAQGKVIFIGDCAPLSFLQTVRHLVSQVDPDGLAVHTSRDSVAEVAQASETSDSRDWPLPTSATEVGHVFMQHKARGIF